MQYIYTSILEFTEYHQMSISTIVLLEVVQFHIPSIPGITMVLCIFNYIHTFKLINMIWDAHPPITVTTRTITFLVGILINFLILHCFWQGERPK